MFHPKLFLFYLIAGTIVIVMLMFDLYSTFPFAEDTPTILEYTIPAIILYFLAYKSFKNDPSYKKSGKRKRKSRNTFNG